MSKLVALPHGCEELRDEIHIVLARYPELTFVAVVGTLELIKLDLSEMLKNCDHPSAQKT